MTDPRNAIRPGGDHGADPEDREDVDINEEILVEVQDD